MAAESTTSDCRALESFDSEEEFMESLGEVLESDYGVQLDDTDLVQATVNINQFLNSFL